MNAEMRKDDDDVWTWFKPNLIAPPVDRKGVTVK